MVDVQLQRVGKQQLRDNYGAPLKVHRLPAIVVQVVHPQHGAVNEARDVGEYPLEVGEERRVVERPFRDVADVPLAERQAVGDSEPIPVDLKVGGFAGRNGVLVGMLEGSGFADARGRERREAH